MILIQRFPLIQTELNEAFLCWKDFSPVDGRSGREYEVGIENNKLESFVLPLGEPNHLPMKWGFPPVLISNPTLGLSDEQPRSVSSWIIVKFGFSVGECRKDFKAAQVVVSQVLAGGAVREGVHKEEEVRLGLLVG